MTPIDDASRRGAGAMSAVKGASLEMADLKGDMSKMQIGLGAALSQAAGEAHAETSAAGSLARRRRRFAVMAVLGAISLTFLAGVSSLRPRPPRSDEYASDWPLRDEIVAATARAGDALLTVAVARSEVVMDGGVPFVVLLGDAARKKAAADAAPDDPFSRDALRSHPELLVRETVFGDYALVLNKFPALPHHALLITKNFSPQAWRLTKRDLGALHRSAAAADALGFYNSDAVAGASQPHRHFQLVFNDAFADVLGDGALAAPPIQAAVDALGSEHFLWSTKAPFVPHIRRLDALAGIAHGLVQLPRRATFSVDFATDGDFDDALLRAYAHLLRDLDLFEQPPYNLLLSKSWLLVVKRRSRDGAGVDVNALGYAGCLLARDESSFARVAAAPRAALAAAAVPSTGY